MRYRLHILQRGQIKDAEPLAWRQEYLKRFRRFGDLQITESKKPQWPEGGFRVVMSEFGQVMGSEPFSALLTKWTEAHSQVSFLVGDAYGHDPATAQQGHYQLSLGPMTLPHQLAHLVLIEQLYRAATIHAGLPYHHG